MGANATYKDIPLRDELIKSIEPYVKAGKYSSITDFVKEAVRLRLEQLKALEAAGRVSRSNH
jgi:Arc/MetJ-type ribon-helix-helix transcriptional regulator